MAHYLCIRCRFDHVGRADGICQRCLRDAEVHASRTPAPPTKDTNQMSALKEQTGGDHYKKMKIQPIEYIHANNIPFAEGSVIKYVTRWRGKNGVEDLKKARHFLDLLIELETRNAE